MTDAPPREKRTAKLDARVTPGARALVEARVAADGLDPERDLSMMLRWMVEYAVANMPQGWAPARERPLRDRRRAAVAAELRH